MDRNVVIRSWVHSYTDDLLHFAQFKTNDKALAEDFVQETFLTAHSRFDNFEERSSPKTWLVAILKNKIIDFQRKEKRQGAKYSFDVFDDKELSNQFDQNGDWIKSQRPYSWDTESTNLLDNTEFIRVLDSCKEDLPVNHEIVIHLKYIENKNATDICQELDISTSNYWQALHRAKLKLRKCLENNWFNDRNT